MVERLKQLGNIRRKTRNLIRRIKSKETRMALKENTEFKDIHKGQRCFILGNGPSLNSEDLSVLEKEYVFTVNQIARHKDFQKIKPNFHFWADANFFNLDVSDPKDRDLLEVMKAVDTPDNHPIVFYPVEQMGFIREHQLDQWLNVHYFKSELHFYDGFNEDIHYERCVPGFGTVVQWCITMAVYMGFSEIYLLGCDMTGIETTVKAALKKRDDSSYAYEVTETDLKRLEKYLSDHSLERYSYSYYLALKGFRNLYEYCSGRGIKLVNCSSETVIDSIPRMPLQAVVGKE